MEWNVFPDLNETFDMLMQVDGVDKLMIYCIDFTVCSLGHFN